MSQPEAIQYDQNLPDNHNIHDEITRKKIEKHLTDINDTISEEDIKNVNTNIKSGNQENTEKEPKDMVNSELDKKELPSTWQVIE